ncbi:MAG: hypothetical protein HYS77_17690 [Candidatus Rokubacteria bacterium]|nr:hypothetical protein [Candidatus Rokubacteria bacterium]
MGCGIGICMGCAIPVRGREADGGPGVRYRLCCRDGPVFDGRDILWA